MRRLTVITLLTLLGAAPPPHLQAQTVESYTFTAHRMVPDGHALGLNDVRNVNSSIGAITSVRVRLKLSGEYNGDLYGCVRHLGGFAVLLNRPGKTASNVSGYGDSGFDVTFQTGAANGDVHVYQNVTTPANGSPLTGAWEPDGRTEDPANVTDMSTRSSSLTNFNGLTAAGEWTLCLFDVESGGTNMLTEWSLEISGAVFEPIPDQMAYVLMPLVLTNRVINPNLLSPPLTFGLGAGAPTGARVRTNGVFYWTPTRAQARSTNVIEVWMTDSGTVSATNIVNIIVDDYLELSLGKSVLCVGQTSSVPVTLVTTAALTNVQVLVEVPENRLTPLALTGWAPEVGNATLQHQAANVWLINFTAALGQEFQGTKELAHLSFLAVPNRSAYVPLVVSDMVTNFRADGSSIWRTLASNGRAVVIEQEFLLEVLPPINGLPNLTLHGVPGVSYKILFAPVLPATGWQPVWLGTMPTNHSTPVSGLTNAGPTMFFHAQEGSGLY